MLIDTHCHLQSAEYAKDLDAVLSRAKDREVEKIICIGTNLEESKKAISLAKTYAQVYASAGIYPDEEAGTKDLREKLLEIAQSEKVVAIGECGLDYSKNVTRSHEEQKELFRKQIGTAIQLDLPLIIHTREADEDTLTELEHYKTTQKLRGVFHCFVGTPDVAKRVFDLGFYVSFTGIITFPSAKNLIETVKMAPLSKILVETDAPWLAPEGFRGKRNEPGYVKLVAEKIAELKGITPAEVAETTTKNANALFSLA